MKRTTLPVLYVTIVISVFITAFSYSQFKDDISGVNVKTPIQYYLASAANWNSEIEVYFNSKVLSHNHSINLLGFNYADKTCGPEYCFKFSTKQNNFQDYRWYPSVIGIDADFFRLFVKFLLWIKIPLYICLFLIYSWHLALNLFFYYLIYRVMLSRTKSRIQVFYFSLIFVSPWMLFGSMNIVFSPALRFLPCFTYLFFSHYRKQSIGRNGFRYAIVISFFLSTFHGFEFTPFMLAACLLLPRQKSEAAFAWVRGWFTLFSIGMLLCLLAWLTVNFFNAGSIGTALMLILHTIAKQSRFVRVEAPEFAIDSGYFALPHWRGMYRYFFETSSILPHPIPSQILELPFVKIASPIIIFLTGIGFIALLIMLVFLFRFRRLDTVLTSSIVCAIAGSWGLSSYVFNHRHYMGLSCAILSILYIGYFNLIKDGYAKSVK